MHIEFKELSLDDINDDLLDDFNRYQEVKNCYVNENGSWIVQNHEYVINWDENEKRDRIKQFTKALSEGGFMFGAFDENRLIGFSLLLGHRFGSEGNYVQLKYLHVSLEYRHKGIGKKLFGLCAEKTKAIRIDKMYISANDSAETQKFYLGMGCVDATEINQQAAEDEPYDRQMEYLVNDEKH